MADEEIFVSDLSGYSGCCIKLYTLGEEYFVRKISGSSAYNTRLQSQMEKQAHFAKELATSYVKTPAILAHGEKEGLFYFDMEYVRGQKIIEQFVDSDYQEVSRLSERICSILDIGRKTAGSEKMLNFFQKCSGKAREIELALSKKQHRKESSSIVSNLQKTIEMGEQKGVIERTYCHGDLTLENIIYDPNTKTLYLLDFLDSFIDHYYFDLSKLFQDAQGHWSVYRNGLRDAHNILPKMDILRDTLFSSPAAKEEFYRKNHYLLLALTFARILPYASENDVIFINQRIREYLGYFKAEK